MNYHYVNTPGTVRPDAIFVGAGINSLVTAYLLGKAGSLVLVWGADLDRCAPHGPVPAPI